MFVANRILSSLGGVLKVNCDRARGARFCWCLGVVVAACLTPVEVFAPTFVAVQVGGDAWAMGNCEQDMARSDQYCDSDGDGIPDKDDPCPNEPNPNCESMTVYGDLSDLPVTCSDGTRVAHVTDCTNYDAIYGNPRSGNDADSESDGGGGGGGSGGGGGKNGNDDKTKVRFDDPDDWTRPLEPIARAIDSCVNQGHADFSGISYVLEFKKITIVEDGQDVQRAMGVAIAPTGETILDIEEIVGADFAAAAAWKTRSAMTSVHELLHHLHPDWNEDQVYDKETDYSDLAERCASAN